MVPLHHAQDERPKARVALHGADKLHNNNTNDALRLPLKLFHYIDQFESSTVDFFAA